MPMLTYNCSHGSLKCKIIDGKYIYALHRVCHEPIDKKRELVEGCHVFEIWARNYK